ncbi:DNA gyrase inhibitor YacG [Duganella sp. SG902]
MPSERLPPPERCKKIDLGAWAEEKYVIPVVAPKDAHDEE